MTEPSLASDEAGFENSPDRIVCACSNLTLGMLQNLAADGTNSFEAILEKSGAGQKCTACLLDLEFQIGRMKGGVTRSPKIHDSSVNSRWSQGFKQKFYEIIDRISPLLPYRHREFAVVLSGTGIRQYVVVANDSLLFEGQICAPSMSVSIFVRDRDGNLCYEKYCELKPDESIRDEISQYLPNDATRSLDVGTVVVERKAKFPGLRGTMRPQILIEAPSGSCSVHLQASNSVGDLWITFLHRPNEERMLFALLNDSDAPLKFSLSYPYPANSIVGSGLTTHEVVVPCLGARLHEYSGSSTSFAGPQDRLVRAKCNAGGKRGRKVYFLCASPQLDRFSVDHV